MRPSATGQPAALWDSTTPWAWAPCPQPSIPHTWAALRAAAVMAGSITGFYMLQCYILPLAVGLNSSCSQCNTHFQTCKKHTAAIKHLGSTYIVDCTIGCTTPVRVWCKCTLRLLEAKLPPICICIVALHHAHCCIYLQLFSVLLLVQNKCQGFCELEFGFILLLNACIICF